MSTRPPVVPGAWPGVVPQDEPEPFDIAARMAQAASLREELERAAQRGDVGAAQALSAELQAAAARLQHHQQRLIDSQPPPPRGPEEGEEERLGKQLALLATRAAKLESKKKKALLEEMESETPDFLAAVDIEAELEEIRYEADGLRARQAEIDAHDAEKEDARKRLAAYRKTRIRDAAEKRRRAKLAKLADAVMPQLKDIRDLARSCGDKEIAEKIIAMLRR
jgi:hypothetical protein